MQLFYNSELEEGQEFIQFSKEESKHIVRVLRKKAGDELHITNGKGIHFTSEIVSADQKLCTANITAYQVQPKRSYHIHLAVAPTKMNDRYEWFLEKATEIGIDSITPIICDNSERKVIKPERYQKILLAAMKQSLNCYLPKLNEAVNFTSFMQQQHNGQLFIAHCEDSNKSALKQSLEPNTDVTILIGPEGDFSPNEIQLALQQHFKPVTLGNTRLRTETAAIVACHSVVFLNE